MGTQNQQPITASVRANHVRALVKLASGEKPTRDEQRDFNRVEKQKRKEILDEYIENVPLTDLQEWFGHGTPRRMQVNQLNDIHNNYGLPVSKSPVSLPKLFQALRALLKANARVLNHKDEVVKSDIAKKRESKLDGEIQRLQQQIKALETRNQKELEVLVEKAQVLQLYQITADVMRACGEDMARVETLTGKDAQERLNNSWDIVEHRIKSVLKTSVNDR